MGGAADEMRRVRGGDGGGNASELLGHRMHDNLHPFTDEENYLAATFTRAEHAVAWAIDAARGNVLSADVEACSTTTAD